MSKIEAKYTNITGGFWDRYRKLNREKIIYAIKKVNEETGRRGALDIEKIKSGEITPHKYWDSDLAKWIEAASYILKYHKDEILEKEIDDMVDLFCKNQDESGYFNSYFQHFETDMQFKKRRSHELYCLGHMIEAAVAYYEVSGKDKFLNMVKKYADLVYKVFYVEKSAAFKAPGHEEIEQALYKLYKLTGDKKYLELSLYFIDHRASEATEADYMWYGGVNLKYGQDHLPVREQRTAEGHSVRAMYLYMGVADIAKETGDKELLEVCDSIFKDIYNKKMYITGGIGAYNHVEGFGTPYFLPNRTAYCETCAAISLVMFCQRMGNIYPKSIYHDVIERVLYNGFLTGVSLDGERFFYQNVLEWDSEACYSNPTMDDGRTPQTPVPERQKEFSVLCCPANLSRLMGRLEEYIYSANEEAVFVNQYIPSNFEKELFGKKIAVEMTTSFPKNGEIKITAKNLKGKKLAIRIPQWCKNYTISEKGELQDGFYYISVDGDEITVTANFEMKPSLVFCNPKVRENAGKAAVMMGPVVYCAEGIDNEENIFSQLIDKDFSYEVEFSDYYNVNVLTVNGKKIKETETPFSNSVEYEKTKIKLIPYFGFANRELTDMRIFFNII
ncbi:MAG: glycoside hydrolase family 127 protein [Clostridia bacterium]|nr:glycoside hydrolase family 127 protein [Clostridia bacterium]